MHDLTGYGHRRIRKLLKDVPPMESKDRRSIYYDSITALEAIYGSENSDILDLTKERARLAKEQADAQELKNAKERGEVLPLDKIKETWARIVVACRTRFLALPDRLAQMLETCESIEDRRALIDAEVKTILIALSEDK